MEETRKPGEFRNIQDLLVKIRLPDGSTGFFVSEEDLKSEARAMLSYVEEHACDPTYSFYLGKKVVSLDCPYRDNLSVNEDHYWFFKNFLKHFFNV